MLSLHVSGQSIWRIDCDNAPHPTSLLTRECLGFNITMVIVVSSSLRVVDSSSCVCDTRGSSCPVKPNAVPVFQASVPAGGKSSYRSLGGASGRHEVGSIQEEACFCNVHVGSVCKYCFSRYIISIITIRRWWDCLIFMMGILILGRQHHVWDSCGCKKWTNRIVKIWDDKIFWNRSVVRWLIIHRRPIILTIMTKWYGNAFTLLAICQRNPPVRWIPGIWCSSAVSLNRVLTNSQVVGDMRRHGTH